MFWTSVIVIVVVFVAGLIVGWNHVLMQPKWLSKLYARVVR